MSVTKYILLGCCLIIIGLGYLAYSLFLPFEIKFFQKDSTRQLIQDSPYYLDADGWRYVMRGEYDGYNSISFEKTHQDTSKHIIFLLNDSNEPFRVFEFKKNYTLNDTSRYFVRMNSTDTLFAYLEHRNGDRFFISGEYFFKYTFMQLDTDQLKYFILHSDSLTKIKGNNLPELPQLNLKERKRYSELLRENEL